MDSFYYLTCGRAEKEEGRHQFQERGKSRLRIRLVTRHKKNVLPIGNTFSCCGQTKPIPKALLG